MSNATPSLSRALSLITLAGLLAGCPAVEPVEPAPDAPTPQSGVWGMHIAEVDGTGLCAELAPAIQGRVVRLDIDADDRGALVATVLGLDLYGGHSDGFVWGDAELELPRWGYGWDEPVVVYEDEPVEPDEPDHSDEDADDDVDGEGADPVEPPCEIAVEEEGEYCELPEPQPEPEPVLDAGVYVSLSAELRHAEALDGALVVTISNGWNACDVEARIDAAFLGEDVDVDWGDDVEILPAVPGDPGEPVVVGSETAPAEG
jgi:hypothetical protein